MMGGVFWGVPGLGGGSRGLLAGYRDANRVWLFRLLRVAKTEERFIASFVILGSSPEGPSGLFLSFPTYCVGNNGSLSLWNFLFPGAMFRGPPSQQNLCFLHL